MLVIAPPVRIVRYGTRLPAFSLFGRGDPLLGYL